MVLRKIILAVTITFLFVIVPQRCLINQTISIFANNVNSSIEYCYDDVDDDDDNSWGLHV